MKQLSMQNDVVDTPKIYPPRRTNQRADFSNVLQRVERGDKNAIEECVNTYGDLIWSMAKKATNSTEDAETVTREIFLNLWRFAARLEQTNFDELNFITIIARGHLRRYTEKSDQ